MKKQVFVPAGYRGLYIQAQNTKLPSLEYFNYREKRIAYSKQRVKDNYIVIRMMGRIVTRRREVARLEGVAEAVDSKDLWKTVEIPVNSVTLTASDCLRTWSPLTHSEFEISV